ncbi:hypothetical protein [Pararoseomonas baculiformis]|uniref:hypothetical protein n=1 Tax=Pararoseomonas baculiformis TaxID=2820812 RepID=UPI001ADFE135|nr:hypothetical protein [Pararoseomonas baculiformis]
MSSSECQGEAQRHGPLVQDAGGPPAGFALLGAAKNPPGEMHPVVGPKPGA